MRSAEPYPSITQPLKRWNNIVKPPGDERNYRGIELPNQMKLLLISDPETKKSAAALDVKVGSLSDPTDIPGLAHFCEHMLFLGTEKYPDPKDFMKYITEHGGKNNAVTLLDQTMYFFDIKPDFFEGALDRFAQFFICPLFREECTLSEVNAIQAEYETYCTKDSWRLDQLEKHMAKPGHPFGKFTNGNMNTLFHIPRQKGINVREELKKFFRKWYSSNIMTAAILGKEDLDQLEKMVVPLFSKIENNYIENLYWHEHPFGPAQFKVASFIVPLQNIRNLTISFPSPDLDRYYRTKPHHYISSLISHEGPGSLFSLLKKRGLGHHLVSGAKIGGKGFGFFYIKIDLTPQGIVNIHSIVKLCFQYLKMLTVEGPQKWFFDEFRKILETDYRFKQKEDPYTYVNLVAKNMQICPLQKVLEAPYVLDKWDPEIIEKVLEMIVPSKIRLAIIGQKFEDIADQEEPWFGTKYKVRKIPEFFIREWEKCDLLPEFELPRPNAFIPSSFEIVPKEENIPHPFIIHETSLTRVWYMTDDQYLLPRANINFEFFTPIVYIDPFNCNLASIYIMVVEESLNEYTYAAGLAGLTWEMKNTEYGIMLSIAGYDDKGVLLFEEIIEKMTNLQITADRFEILKENYIKSLENFHTQQPPEQTMYYLSVLISDHAWNMDELLKATEGLTLNVLEDFIPQIFSSIYVECLMHGNITKTRALEYISVLERKLDIFDSVRPLQPLQLLRRRELELLDWESFTYEVLNKYYKSSCTELYYQCNAQSTHSNMLIELLVQLMTEPAFDALQTQEQGNMVYFGVRRSNCAQGLRVVLQSRQHPMYLERKVEAFLLQMREILINMEETELERHKVALENILLEKPKTLAAATKKYWREINLQQYHFNRAEEEVACLRKLNKEDLLDYFDIYIKYDAPCRRKLSVHILPETDDGNEILPDPGDTTNSSDSESSLPPLYIEPIIIKDVAKFKCSHGLLPLAQPQVNLDSFIIYANTIKYD